MKDAGDIHSRGDRLNAAEPGHRRRHTTLNDTWTDGASQRSRSIYAPALHSTLGEKAGMAAPGLDSGNLACRSVHGDRGVAVVRRAISDLSEVIPSPADETAARVYCACMSTTE